MESDTASGSETLSLISSSSYSKSFIWKLVFSKRRFLPGPGYKWLITKPVITVIFINFIVGVVYAAMRITTQVAFIFSPYVITLITLVNLLVALASTIFSPLFGFLADVHFGRCRVLSASICLIFVACIFVCLIVVLRLLVTAGVWSIHLYNHDVQPVAFGLGAVAVLLLLPGIASYQANFIPFGLDQLCDAPSVSLALFIHWVVYADRLGTFVIQIVDAVYECISAVKISESIFILLFAVCLSVTVMLVLIIVCLKQCQFNVENQRSNPYRMIYKVLVFARKHRYPLCRSAFTYCDNEVPSRLDFAKERFGGPFTTEQVEDVKTFFKILLVLLALSPIFVLEVPASFVVTTAFTIHIQDASSSYFNRSCSARFVLLEKDLIPSLISLILLPLFIWIIFSLLQCHLLSIFSRLWFAALVYLLGVASMLCIDLAGHIVHNRESPQGTSMCMFILHHHHGFDLKLHWSVLLVPYLLLGLGQPLIMASAFEFISAQSPSSMKGLLVGVFISVKAFFQLISGIVLMPFSWKSLWDSEHMREHPLVTNCGFGYLLFTCVVALIGLILLLVVARRYKYRERDDRPFDQRFAVDVYSRYLQ